MLIAEDLLLLLHDLGEEQNIVVRGDIALAGAVLADLADIGKLGLSQDDGDVEAGRLQVLDKQVPTSHSVLYDAMWFLAENEGSEPMDVLPLMTENLRARLVASVIEQGAARESGKDGGMELTEEGAAWRDRLRAGLRAVLRSGDETELRVITLLGLLSGADLEDAVLEPTDTVTDADELDRREWLITDGVWVRDEVARAVQGADTAASGMSPFLPDE